mmetsp:Transcript_22018/g.21198  ORF Transcript_22018/g.21198 Transcript_22018/m.21198 type:complete len:82 (+) Transcript_22018:1382-1627(+)
MNELVTLIVGYHLFMFTDFVGDLEIQYRAGISVIVIVLFILLVNLGVIIIRATFNLVQWSRQQWRKCNHKLIDKPRNRKYK